MLAIILSVIFPGLGHIYLKKPGRGIILMALSFIWILLPFVFIFSVIDCYRLNKKVAASDRLTGKEAVIGIIGFFIVVPALIFALVFFIMMGLNFIRSEYYYPIKTEHELSTISTEMEVYKQSFGVYPPTIIDLIASKPIRVSWKSDAWQRPYVYQCNGVDYQITSMGKDGVLNTSDDISISSKNLE